MFLVIMQSTLAEALNLTAQIISQVRDRGRALPIAIATVCPATLPDSLRGAAQDISYLSMRKIAAAEAILSALTNHMPSAYLRNILFAALALLLDEDRRYPDFTVVDQAVMAVAKTKMRSGKGLINAVLRQFLRQRQELIERLQQMPTTRWNFPLWWITRLRAAYPQTWELLLAQGNQSPPMVLRINQAHCQPKQILSMLANAAIEAKQIGSFAICLAQPRSVHKIPGFDTGLLSVQDAGAQLAIPLLDIHHGMRILDACAAPGGKTGQLLETAAVQVVALEVDSNRAQRIEENIARVNPFPGANASIVIGDAKETRTWWDGQLFDRILVDAPCSASGIVRRHPDIRWLRRPGDIQKLVKQQRHILCSLWPLLAPKGKLLYATCSIFPEEGEAQAQWFERTQMDAVRLHAPGQLLPGVKNYSQIDLPDDYDGFFYALFEKK